MEQPQQNSSFLQGGGKRGANAASKQEVQQVQREKLLNLIEFYNPYLTMPLGVNNIYIEVAPEDVGSIIAFALNSNVYFEALAKLNYMGLENKVNKQKDK